MPNYLSPLQRVVGIEHRDRGIWLSENGKISYFRDGGWKPRSATGFDSGTSYWQSSKIAGDGRVPRYILSWFGTYARYWSGVQFPKGFEKPFVKPRFPSSKGIFKNGKLLSEIPLSKVAGCAVRRYGNQEFLIAVSHNQVVYRSPLSDPTNWEEIGNFSVQQPDENPCYSWFFNSSGTEAHRVQDINPEQQISRDLVRQKIVISPSGSITATEQIDAKENRIGTVTTTTYKENQSGTSDEEITVVWNNDESKVVGVDYDGSTEKLLEFTASGQRNSVRTDESFVQNFGQVFTLKLAGEPVVTFVSNRTVNRSESSSVHNDFVQFCRIFDADIRNRFVAFEIETAQRSYDFVDSQGNANLTITLTYEQFVWDSGSLTKFSSNSKTETVTAFEPMPPVRTDESGTSETVGHEEPNWKNDYQLMNQKDSAHCPFSGYLVARPTFHDWETRHSGSDDQNIFRRYEYTTNGENHAVAVGVPFDEFSKQYFFTI